MLKRSTTKILADILHALFSSSRTVQTINGRREYYSLQVDSLYDFLYERGYEAWFLNAAHNLYRSNERALREFIMRLHTGETVASSTQDWTWQQRAQLGQRLLRDLAQDILITSDQNKYMQSEAKRLVPQLISELELDGYLFRDGKLYFTEAAILNTEDEQGILEKLIKDLALSNQDVMKHTLELSETHYLDGKWDDCIANSRRFLEAVLQEIAAKYYLQKMNGPIATSVNGRWKFAIF